MLVKLIDAVETASLLQHLCAKHDEIHVAVAWGSKPIADSLLRHTRKFQSVTFGVAFCQTDPDLIDCLVDCENAYIAESQKRTFHPKVYYFSSGNDVEAIVGSSNFTRGGFERNYEANVHIIGSKTDGIFNQIRAGLKRYEKVQIPVTREIAAKYRLQFNAAKRLPKPKNPSLKSERLAKQLGSSLVSMDWESYVSEVKSSKHFSHSDRLALLRKCQQLFSSTGTFSELSANQWKAIAGVIGDRQKHEASLGEYDWRLFGSMRGMGEFGKLIKEKDIHIASAIDGIPRRGNVEKHHYKRFCKDFLRAFQNSARTGSHPTATRLLAMKRPDVFVCISKPNQTRISSALDFPPTTLKLENYWDRVIEPIRYSRWFNAPRPTGEDAELWDNRVAMIDAFFYSP